MSFRTASEGYWTIFLIPFAICLQDVDRYHKPILMIVTINSVMISLFQVAKIDFNILLPVIQKWNLLLSVVTLCFCIDKGGSPYLFFSYIAINYAFPHVFLGLIKLFPKSFTFGEAIILCQAFFFAFWAGTTNLLTASTRIDELSHTVVTVLFGHAGFLLCLIICRILLFVRKPWTFSFLDFIFCLWTVGSIAVFFWKSSLTELQFLTEWLWLLIVNPIGARLVLLWLVLTVGAILFAVVKHLFTGYAGTIDRKVYHLILVLTFVPGILFNFGLMYFWSVAAVCAFILLETFRLLRVTFFNIPVGDIIDNCGTVFRDHQDEGITILTPIYLLAGCSLPLWLNLVGPEGNTTIVSGPQVAAALSGILSIGVGDTFASIGGSTFGGTKWNGSLKSVEGTLFSISSQLLFIYALWTSGYVAFSGMTLIYLVIAAVINAFVEAKTDQIDNLVLPLLTYNLVIGLPKLYNILQQLLLQYCV